MVKEKKKSSSSSSGSTGEMLSLQEVPSSLEEGMLPLEQLSAVDILCILHKCRTERNLALALCLHDAYMCQSGLLEAHASLGNHLVSVLVEVGSMAHAQQVFDLLVYRDQCSWNSLITGYAKEGESRHALTVYQKMLEDPSLLHPSGYAFVALLKACAALNDLERGCELHAEIARLGLSERDIFVGSTLVDMYAKCGSLAKAQEVFDRLPVQDVVSWTALIAGYAEHGHGEKALYYFEQMQHRGISPDALTLVCSLRACGSLGVVDKGREIHVDIARKGLERQLLVGNTLVDVYAKWGLLATALEVFDKLPVRDVVSWNALIAGYAEHGCGEEALHCFEQMQCEGISQDAVTFVCILKACGTIGATVKGHETYAEIARKGLERELLVGSTLVNMYSKCGLLAEAQDVFDKLPVPNVVLWNALMAGYTDLGRGEEALNCFERMQHDRISSSAITFVFSLKACGSIGATVKGQEIHADIVRKGLERELLVGSTLVDMYGKCGSLAEGQKVFNKLPLRDVVSWTALMAGYAEHGHGVEVLDCYKQMQHEGISLNAVTCVCILKACGSVGATDEGQKIHADIARKGLEKELLVGNTLVDMYVKCGLLETAQDVFDKLPVQDLISWNALISGYAEHGCGEKALDCFEQMRLEGIPLNAITIVCSLKACGSIGATVKCQGIHAEIARKGLEGELLVGNTMIDTYAKFGSLAEAQVVFDKLPLRDVVSWTALMAGYAQLGESANVFHFFDRMIGEGIKPNLVTFVSVLNACSHAGLVDKGQMYFEAIRYDYGFTPTVEHYTCMVDLLGRAGHVEKAVAMIRKMPLQPDNMVWQKIMGACQKWGNVELGRHAFEHAVRLDEKGTAAYVCMSNIYAHAAMHEEANMVEVMRLNMDGEPVSTELCIPFWLGIKDISKGTHLCKARRSFKMPRKVCTRLALGVRGISNWCKREILYAGSWLSYACLINTQGDKYP